jgi:hypothetical protein
MIRMVDEGNPNCDHQYFRGSEWCAICGRYRHADQVKELVAKAPPLSQDQINRISLIFNSTAKDIDWTAVAAEGVTADVIPAGCCGRRLPVGELAACAIPSKWMVDQPILGARSTFT